MIWCDIEKLNEVGWVCKVYGGVVVVECNGCIVLLFFVENCDIVVDVKCVIVCEVEKLVQDGSLIIIYGGLICFYFGCCIVDRNLCVFIYFMLLVVWLVENGIC